MIRIRVCRHEDGLEISAVGHAGFAERGRDIVCAGVSALLFGLVRYLELYSGRDDSAFPGEDGSGGCPLSEDGGTAPSLQLKMGDGELWVRTRHMEGADMAAWSVMRAGLLLITEDYPAYVALAEDDRICKTFMERNRQHGHGNHCEASGCGGALASSSVGSGGRCDGSRDGAGNGDEDGDDSDSR